MKPILYKQKEVAGRLQQPNQIDLPNPCMQDKQKKPMQNSKASDQFHNGVINCSLLARPKSEDHIREHEVFGSVCFASEPHFFGVLASESIFQNLFFRNPCLQNPFC